MAVQKGPAAASELTRPAGLDRERILQAALDFIDEQGLAALTMRRLGSSLGVEAMALYRYVPGREDLLDGVVDRVVETLFDDQDGDDIYIGDHAGWQDYLVRLAHGMRRIALAHPAVFPLIASRPPGFRTRTISRNTAGLSGARLITQLLMTQSTPLSSSGN